MHSQDARGVSDVIGFTLVFGLIITSVGIVYATGFESLQGARDQEELRNVERAFDILAENIHEVSRGEAPSRDTELQLGTNQMYSGEEVTLTIRITNSSGATTTVQTSMSPIVYETEANSRVLYVNGAVIRETQGEAMMVRQPSLMSENGRLLLPMVDTRPANGDTGVAGGTIIVRTRSTGSTTLSFHDPTETYSVEFTLETPRPEVWRDYCQQHEQFVVESMTNSSVTCEHGSTVTAAYVQFRRIEVIFDA